MGDEGLAYGAACAGALKLDRVRALELAGTPVKDVYLGNDLPPADIEEALAAEGLLEAPTPEIEV